DARGALHELHRHALAPAAARRWTEASCDLSAFAGQSVELRLSNEVARAGAPDRRSTARAPRPRAPAPPASAYGGPGNGRPDLDAGVVREDALASPGSPVAVWGNPTLLARTRPRVPYNVLWIV